MATLSAPLRDTAPERADLAVAKMTPPRESDAASPSILLRLLPRASHARCVFCPAPKYEYCRCPYAPYSFPHLGLSMLHLSSSPIHKHPGHARPAPSFNPCPESLVALPARCPSTLLRLAGSLSVTGPSSLRPRVHGSCMTSASDKTSKGNRRYFLPATSTVRPSRL